jgi:septal ring factor EnvC (AmiA/AmiB activator)|tara:strand:+ start:1274 stop:1522 length:249 start_codon:yes stop_codon:yes gene_type:complete
MGIKYDKTTGLPSNDNTDYNTLLDMWREEKEKRQKVEGVNNNHQELNGKLQVRVSELEEDNKKLSKQIEDKDKYIKQLIDVM